MGDLMGDLKFLKSKEIKQILALLKEQWGYEGKLDYIFMMDDEGDIFLINKDISKIQFENLRINSVGLYFAEYRNDELRLSIEGSQIIGRGAKKNVLEISDEQIKHYVKGEDMPAEGNYRGFVILTNRNDFFGCSKIKNGELLNFYPKSRRINAF
jgi:NOL1/NOP2/fmu family ribosome biogenesis protein